jgi:hypothetical protein
MILKIVSWNVRGINDARKRVSNSNLLKSWKPNVVRLQETKMDNIFVGTIEACGVVPSLGRWCYQPLALLVVFS